MKEQDLWKFSAAVSDYKAYGDSPKEPSSEKVLWEVAWAARYIIEAEERWLPRVVAGIEHGNILSRVFSWVTLAGIIAYERWHLHRLMNYAIEDKSPDSEFKNCVAINSLRYLRPRYLGTSRVDVHPFVDAKLSELEEASLENPLLPLFKSAVSDYKYHPQ